MTQRDLVKIAAGAVAGLAVAAVLGAGLFGFNLFGDTVTAVTLWTPASGGPCTLGKAPYVRAKKGKKVIWEIENYCSSASTVTVGNFRKTPGPSGATNCDGEGTDYPFTDPDLAKRSVTVAPASDDDITLKVKGRDELGENADTYYFDICLNGEKKDPELMIER